MSESYEFSLGTKPLIYFWPNCKDQDRELQVERYRPKAIYSNTNTKYQHDKFSCTQRSTLADCTVAASRTWKLEECAIRTAPSLTSDSDHLTSTDDSWRHCKDRTLLITANDFAHRFLTKWRRSDTNHGKLKR